MQGIQITASMLYDHVLCPHRVGLDIFGDPAERDAINPFVELLWERGHAFEQEVINALDLPVVNLKQVPPSERETQTLDAIAARAELIYGGRISAGNLLGEPDILMRSGSGYIPGDIKNGVGLSGRREDTKGKPQTHYAAPLGLYTDILKRKALYGEGVAFVWDVHGEKVDYDLELARGPRISKTMWQEYEGSLNEVRSIVARHVQTASALSVQCKLCHWRSHCFKEVVAKDDLTLIPELGRARRDALIEHVNTVTALADIDLAGLINGNRSVVSGVGLGMLQRLQARARFQKQPDAKPYFTENVQLPSNTLELFFDVETDPTRDICYLHGFLERSNSDPQTEKYVSFIANEPTPEAEKAAFSDAWNYVRTRPASAMYFYSTGKKTTWWKLANRFPDVASDEEVAELFEREASVDLCRRVVCSKMQWPTYDFSIRTVASFLGFKWRDPDPSETASIQWYHKWLETGDPGIRTRIMEYNEDDCVAMRVLVDAVREMLAGA